MRQPLGSTVFAIASVFAAGCTSPGSPPADPEAAPAPDTASASGADRMAAHEEVSILSASMVQDEADSPPRGDRPLSLDQAIKLALEQNPDLQMIAARVAQAEAMLAEARSAYLPSMGVDVGWLRADAPSMYLFKTIDSGNFAPGTNFNDPGAFTNWEAGIGLTYNLYNGGRDRLQERIASDGIEMERLQRAVAENALTAAVIGAWYDVHAAEQGIETAMESVRTTSAQVEEARVRVEAGRSLQSDLLSLEVRQAESREMLIRTQNGRELGLTAMAQLLGLDAGQELALVGTGLAPGQLPESFDEALDRAMLQRPELEQARRAVQIAERKLEKAEAGILPTADLFARGWRDTPDFDWLDSRDNWALGVTLSWNFYDGGRRGAGVDHSRAGLDEMLRADRKAVLSVQLDVKSAWVRLRDASSRLEVAESAVARAQETLRLVEAQYEGGAATVTRFLEAELMTTEASMRHTQAKFDLEKARAGLARALGEFHASRKSE